MKSWARAALVAISIGTASAWSIARAAEAGERACLSAGETRDTLQSHKLIQPYRAVAEAARGGGGESIGIRLCRYNTAMVYDVTLLRHDGHIVHMLVDASSGSIVSGR